MDFPIVYAVKHKNFDVRMASRSGGIFTAVTDEVLRKCGIVYGCALNWAMEAVHIRAQTKEERDRMRGSKYVQSNMADTFQGVLEDLNAGRRVLFSGTSCQVAGLKAFLSKDYGDRLFCLDILCHGVPSPLVFKKYLEWQEEQNKAKCIEVDFRNKKDFGWAVHVESLKFEEPDGKVKTIDSKVFANIFCSDKALRGSCYVCPYKDIAHPGDMTIGDFWGVNRAVPDFDDDCGSSLVLINTKNAQKLFDAVKKKLDYHPCRIEDSMQTSLKKPFPRPRKWEQFWDDFYGQPFDYIAKKYGHYSEESSERISDMAKEHLEQMKERQKNMEKKGVISKLSDSWKKITEKS